METASEKKIRMRRSEKMTPSEHKAFANKVDSFDVKADAAEFFGFSTVTIDNILIRKSGKPSTLQTIREKLKEPLKAA